MDHRSPRRNYGIPQYSSLGHLAITGHSEGKEREEIDTGVQQSVQDIRNLNCENTGGEGTFSDVAHSEHIAHRT